MKEPKKPAPPVTSTRRVPQKLDPPFFLILESYTKVPGSPPYPNREQHVPEKPEPGAAVEKGPESSGGDPPGRPLAGSGKAHLFPAAVRETQQGPAQDARGIIGVESADGEAVCLEDRALAGEVLLEQRGQRRALRHAEELLHGMPAPVLGPELGGGGARVVGERHGRPQRLATLRTSSISRCTSVPRS